VADGYSDVIRAYESSRKSADHESSTDGTSSSRSPSRGRSPGRAPKSAKSSSTTAKSSSKSPGRPRGRPRSNSTGRSPSASRRRSSSKSKDSANGTGTDSESSSASRRRAPRKSEKAEEGEETKNGTADGDELLRKTLAALDQAAPPRQDHPSASPLNGEKKATTVQLAYEEVASVSSQEQVDKAPASPSKVTTKHEDTADAAGLQDLWQRLNEGNWLLWFLSVVVVAASLLASQLLPNADDQETGVVPGGHDIVVASQWRLWLPFLTPTVALLLVFHQREERSLAKWVAIALSWRIAAELSIFFVRL
jgi:hypothetical protein